MGRGGQRPPEPCHPGCYLAAAARRRAAALHGAGRSSLRPAKARRPAPGRRLRTKFRGRPGPESDVGGLHGFADPQKTRAWLTHMRVRDKELERRIVRRAKPDAYSEGDNVSAHLARIEREASSFNELAQKGRVPPPEPPSHLIERDLGGELGTRVRWLFRRKAHSQKTSLHAATKAPTAYWPWLVFVVTAFLASYVMWVEGQLPRSRYARPARPVTSLRGDARRVALRHFHQKMGQCGISVRGRRLHVAATSGRCSTSSATTSRRTWKARTRTSSTRGAT